MNPISQTHRFWARLILIVGSALVFLYSWAYLFVVPYIGFLPAVPDGEIINVFLTDPGIDKVQVGDRFIRGGTQTWQEFIDNPAEVLFQDAQAGENYLIVVERNGSQISLMWEFPGLNPDEFYLSAAAGMVDTFYIAVWGDRHIYICPTEESFLVFADDILYSIIGLGVGRAYRAYSNIFQPLSGTLLDMDPGGCGLAFPLDLSNASSKSSPLRRLGVVFALSVDCCSRNFCWVKCVGDVSRGALPGFWYPWDAICAYSPPKREQC